MHFPYFILPFDHRNNLAKQVIKCNYPFSDNDLAIAKDLKMMVFEAILKTRDLYQGNGSLACLFDEETAMNPILEAQKNDLPLILSMEKSGTKTLELIHGENFGDAVNKLKPAYGKLLVHYHPGNEIENVPQRAVMKKVSDFCDVNGIPLMLEILLDKPEGHTTDDMLQVFTEIHADNIKVGVWKIEGFNDAEAWKTIAPHAQAPMIILGRGQDQAAVETWVQAAAQSGVVDGFAIGRTIFEAALSAYVAGDLDRHAAVQKISDNYLHFIHLWETYA
jgi:5-dehydro-2-deoxygluconokinase